MSTQMPSDQPTKWLGLPVIATIARLLCRELTLQNEYLCLENKILKSKIKGRIRFTNDERRSLVDAALAMGRKLCQPNQRYDILRGNFALGACDAARSRTSTK